VQIAWATDAHLNFLTREQIGAFVRRVLALGAAGLALTGDIAEAKTVVPFVEQLAASLRIPIWFVLGNHDFYGGRIATVRAQAKALTEWSPHARWMPAVSVLSLTPQTAIVGQDGWGDGRAGTPEKSRVLLNDWRLIEDFAKVAALFNLAPRLERVRALADESASALARDLDAALTTHEEVIVLTHVPPFDGACWHEGRQSDAEWLPWFTCRAVGDILLAAAERHPRRHIRVYCGHTHSGGAYTARANLVVYTGAATYGETYVESIAIR
jgi:predicted MPP superfamily phosphohydrolase